MSRELRALPIVYRRPTTLRFKKASQFAAVVASQDLAAAQRRVSRLPGAEVVQSVQLADHVQMRLVGAPNEVEVVATSDPTRLVSDVANVTWTWRVTPLVPEPIELELVVYNVALVGEKEVTIDGPVYAERFTVEAPLIDRLNHWVANVDPLFKWLGSIFGILGGGGLIGWLAMARKPKEHSASGAAPGGRSAAGSLTLDGLRKGAKARSR